MACRITHLSLRYNKIGDAGAEQLGRCLGNASSQNTHLLTLNLAGNRITDVGACHISNVSCTDYIILILCVCRLPPRLINFIILTLSEGTLFEILVGRYHCFQPLLFINAAVKSTFCSMSNLHDNVINCCNYKMYCNLEVSTDKYFLLS